MSFFLIVSPVERENAYSTIIIFIFKAKYDLLQSSRDRTLHLRILLSLSPCRRVP
jgi:hypothetical protein